MAPRSRPRYLGVGWQDPLNKHIRKSLAGSRMGRGSNDKAMLRLAGFRKEPSLPGGRSIPAAAKNPLPHDRAA